MPSSVTSLVTPSRVFVAESVHASQASPHPSPDPRLPPLPEEVLLPGFLPLPLPASPEVLFVMSCSRLAPSFLPLPHPVVPLPGACVPRFRSAVEVPRDRARARRGGLRAREGQIEL